MGFWSRSWRNIKAAFGGSSMTTGRIGDAPAPKTPTPPQAAPPSTPPETDASLVLSRRRELSEATPADLADLDERTGAGDEGTGAEPRGAGVAFLALAAAVVVAALLALRRGA